MAPAFRHSTLAALGIAALSILAAVVCVTGYFAITGLRHTVPATPKAPEPREALATGAPAELWSVFRSTAGDAASAAGRSSPARLRLAGTFCVENERDGIRRRAVIESPARREQYVVGEGDAVEDATVEKIDLDRVTIRSPTGTEELRLEFAGRAGTTDLAVATATNLTNAVVGATATNRFGGIKVSENRWQFSRSSLVGYYQELLEEPQRMVAVFDSLKPVRNQANKITGYVLGTEGEKEFFDAIGLQEGDVVRKANSMDMTSRRRAEYLIDEFLKNRLNVVVLDVERSGNPVKLIYSVSP